jgi:ribitol 2-dehydrogenase
VETLKDSVAIVTGASSGIGRAYVRSLAAEGASVTLVGRSTERLEAIAADLDTETLVVTGDISDPGVCAEVTRQTMDRWGRIDILMSNAGLYVAGDFIDADLSAVRAMLDVNVFGAIAIIREALPLMTEAGSGDIILTSSVAGHQDIVHEPAYSASKHAVQAFTHSLRRQLAGTGVRVGAIAPGIVLNELWGIAEGDDTQATVDRAEGITSEDVAEAALFMLSRPRHVTIRDLVILPRAQDI